MKLREPYDPPRLQNVARTALPDGSVITYKGGMEKPEVKCLGQLTKITSLWAANELRLGRRPDVQKRLGR